LNPSFSGLEIVAEVLSQTGDKLLVTARTNPKAWGEYRAMGVAVANEAEDVAHIEFASTRCCLGLTVFISQEDGLVVASLLPEGDAAADGRLRVGDQILYVDDHQRFDGSGWYFSVYFLRV
jgi:hypothetical protein